MKPPAAVAEPAEGKSGAFVIVPGDDAVDQRGPAAEGYLRRRHFLDRLGVFAKRLCQFWYGRQRLAIQI